MPEAFHYLTFVAGFVILIKGADILIDGASFLAKKFHVPQIVIGLTVVAFGTSAPEFVINMVASVNGKMDIALGNILGSNTANVCLILGVSSLIYPLSVKPNTLYKEIPFSIFCVVLLALFVNEFWLGGNAKALDSFEGMILLILFVLFLLYIFFISKNADAENVEVKNLKTYQGILYIILGLAGLTIGGKWIFDATLYIARSLGVSEFVIALTLVALGTSLPELAASVAAVLKKECGYSYWGVVGSNIFNILWVLGASSLVNPIPFDEKNNTDILVVLASSLLLFLFILTSRKKNLATVAWGMFSMHLFRIYLLFL